MGGHTWPGGGSGADGWGYNKLVVERNKFGFGLYLNHAETEMKNTGFMDSDQFTKAQVCYARLKRLEMLSCQGTVFSQFNFRISKQH